MEIQTATDGNGASDQFVRTFQDVGADIEFRIDYDARHVHASGTRLHFTDKEFQVLAFFTRNEGGVCTKLMILRHLYDDLGQAELKIIDVFVCKVRKKLAAAMNGNHGIRTVWGRATASVI